MDGLHFVVFRPILTFMKYDQKDGYRHSARYNARANQELYQVLAQLTGRARKKDTGSWFGSLHGIANHLLVADLFWLNRFKPLLPQSTVLNDERLSPPGLSWQGFLHEDFETMRLEREFVDGKITAWFDEYPAELYGNPFVYTDSAGTRLNAVAGRAFEFLFLHQIHHRAQISQVLDELGLPNNIADNEAFLDG